MASKKADNRVPVSMGALVQRINRKLKQDEEVLHKTKGARALIDLGDYYVRNWRTPNIVDDHVDPEVLGREMGVLKEYERVVEED
jgi:hypothetical protein